MRFWGYTAFKRHSMNETIKSLILKTVWENISSTSFTAEESTEFKSKILFKIFQKLTEIF